MGQVVAETLVDEAITLAKQAWPGEDVYIVRCCLGVSQRGDAKIYNRDKFNVETVFGTFGIPRPHMSSANSLEQLVSDLRELVLKSAE